MRRTGDSKGSTGRTVAVALALLVAVPAVAFAAQGQLEFYQAADRTEVGTEDVFQLTVVTSNAPAGAQLKLPSSPDFEVLSRSESTQMSYQLLGGGPGVIKQVRKYVLLMRANRAGSLIIPPSTLSGEGKTWRTEPVKMTVKRGRLGNARAQAQASNSPFDQLRNFPGFGQFQGFPDDEPDQGDPDEDSAPDISVPRNSSDLFVRSVVDKKEVTVGEQVTLTLYIYSRVDLSEVSQLSMPKLDGFWSEDIDSPTQLSGTPRVINGLPYREYMLKRRALFPVKPGQVEISPAEVDVVTGFLFAGQRVHRVGNTVTIDVKPLPVQGKPPSFNASNVGSWRLSTEVSASQVELGQPVTVRVILDGRGNLHNVGMPPLSAPASMRVFDPTTTDKVNTVRGKFGGRKVQEYLVMPQQTGAFTLPAIAFNYFDPDSGRYEVSRTDPISLQVTPGSGGNATALKGPTTETGEQKNVLNAGGLRPLRYQAAFGTSVPLWKRPFFLPVAAAPVVAWLAFGLIGFARARLAHEDAGTRKKRQARAARKRLAEAERLQATGKPDQFYGEVERAVLGFLEAKLGVPVVGLTRDKLAEAMSSSGVPEARRRQVLEVLDQCDLGRFAPGTADTARGKVLDAAEDAMEGWDAR